MTDKKDIIQTTIRLKPETKQKLDLLCYINKLPISDYITNLINKDMEQLTSEDINKFIMEIKNS